LALNNGENVFSLVLNPYLKTALNENNAVHIGTRIIRFFDNGGVVFVLNNDWDTYDVIKSLQFDDIKFSTNIFITSDSRNNWTKLYYFDANNQIIGEINYDDTEPPAEMPAFCDFSENIITTDLNNGNLRIELDFSITYDIYEWTFPDGTVSYDYPLIIDCDEIDNGSITLNVFMFCAECPSGSRRICRGSVDFECDCGEKKIRKETLVKKVNGQKWKIDAAIWVKSGEVGCRMKYLRKRLFVWLPSYNQGVCTDIEGTYNRESVESSCTDINIDMTKCLGTGTFPTSISVQKSEIPNIFAEPNTLSSGHKVKVKGTWFGFGVGSTPRLALE
jgi:hypothetical protein